MTREIKTDKPPKHICPFMSGTPIPVDAPQTAIMKPNQVAIGPMAVPCLEDRCPLYNSELEVCVIGDAAEISYQLKDMVSVFRELKLVLSPPIGSPSPLMRVAESLEKIVENAKPKEGKDRPARPGSQS